MTEREPIEIPEGSAVVVYDKASGAVRHVHEEVTLPGGEEPTHAEIVANAVAHAKAHAPEGELDLASVDTLVVHPRELRAAGHFRVDPKAGKIVPHAASPQRP